MRMELGGVAKSGTREKRVIRQAKRAHLVVSMACAVTMYVVGARNKFMMSTFRIT